MSLIKSKSKSSKAKLINLQVTTKLTPQNIVLPELDFLNDNLIDAKEGSAIDKAVWCILNSIITQKRVCFTLSKRSLRDMLKSDENDLNVGLKDSNYRHILGMLLDDSDAAPFIKLIHKGNKSYAYEVVHTDILEHLIVDVSKQRSEAIAFSDAAEETETAVDPVPAAKPVPVAAPISKPSYDVSVDLDDEDEDLFPDLSKMTAQQKRAYHIAERDKYLKTPVRG